MNEFSDFNILESKLISEKLNTIMSTRGKRGRVEYVVNILARLLPDGTENEILELLDEAELDTL